MSKLEYVVVAARSEAAQTKLEEIMLDVFSTQYSKPDFIAVPCNSVYPKTQTFEILQSAMSEFPEDSAVGIVSRDGISAWEAEHGLHKGEENE